MPPKSAPKTVRIGRREHTKMVIFPREPIDGPEGKIYRYLIAGLVATDQPLGRIEGHNELFIDGPTALGDALDDAAKYRRKAKLPLGEISNIITELNIL